MMNHIVTIGAVSMMLQRRGGADRSSVFAQPLVMDGALYFVLAVVSGFLVWYLAQRIVAALLIRKATKFCPTCFSPRIVRAPRRMLESVIPFVRAFRCRKCGRRFFRGRKPPFARCPVCRASDLQTVERVTGSLGKIVSATFRGHNYECLRCAARFTDARPLRSNVELPPFASQPGVQVKEIESIRRSEQPL